VSHPFKVGKLYRNRVGEYEVKAIEGDQITIKYVGGATLTTNVGILARIWENVQFEDQLARDEERRQLAKEARQAARRRKARAKRELAKPKFGGFVESDFEAKKRGIAWASRKQLGAVLAYELSQRLPGDFGFWIVPRKSEVHIARKDRFDAGNRDNNAGFFVAVDDEGVKLGFYAGKPGGKIKAGWPWPALLGAFVDDDKTRRALRAAMKAHKLSMDVYAMDVAFGQVGQILLQDRGFLYQHETADQELTKRMNWQALVDYLQSVAPNKRCVLYLRKHLLVGDALGVGADRAAQILGLFQALMPVYDASVGV
jgi:hypothetical protein